MPRIVPDMVCGVRRFLSGAVVLVGLGSLAACSTGGFLAEREPWRKEAEVSCLTAGAVREGPGVVRVKPINGPGTCGADYPLKVSSLGEPGALGFNDDMRPPGAIPGRVRELPRWPIAEAPPRMTPTQPGRSQVDSRPLPPPAGDERDPPMSLDPPNAAPVPMETYDYRRPYGAAPSSAPRTAPAREERQDARPSAPRALEPRRAEPLGPPSPRTAQASATISVTPAATLACPLVAALDRWVAESVQPAALRWFGQQVVEIRQISAYSCRGMNGNPRARISEHAFGNALDIAAFTLASGKRITVKDGWRGSPEEQGFLRDVQGAACDRFTTVLAPGSNAFHYDHMHVDLMKRRNGYRACNPRAVSGEEVAARVRARYARQGRDPGVTGSIDSRRKLPKRLPPPAFAPDKIGHQLPLAIPGEDGED